MAATEPLAGLYSYAKPRVARGCHCGHPARLVWVLCVGMAIHEMRGFTLGVFLCPLQVFFEFLLNFLEKENDDVASSPDVGYCGSRFEWFYTLLIRAGILFSRLSPHSPPPGLRDGKTAEDA